MKTSENLQPPDLLQMELPLTSSAAASRAKTSASQEKSAEWAPKHGLAYGLKSPVLLAKLDQSSSSWRTYQTCLLAQAEGMEDGLAEFSETWPRSGMMQSGTAYQLPTLVAASFGTEFGLWPTPNATAFKGGRQSGRRGKANPERNNWQDWCSLRLGQRYPVPETGEQVMGFPMGHTEIKP